MNSSGISGVEIVMYLILLLIFFLTVVRPIIEGIKRKSTEKLCEYSEGSDVLTLLKRGPDMAKALSIVESRDKYYKYVDEELHIGAVSVGGVVSGGTYKTGGYWEPYKLEKNGYFNLVYIRNVINTIKLTDELYKEAKDSEIAEYLAPWGKQIIVSRLVSPPETKDMTLDEKKIYFYQYPERFHDGFATEKKCNAIYKWICKEEPKTGEEIRALEEKKEKSAEKRETIRKTVIKAGSGIMACILLIFFVTQVIIPKNNYNKAVELMEAGEYEAARAEFESLDDYRDSGEQILNSFYLEGKSLLENSEYKQAIEAFRSSEGYKDANKLMKEASMKYLASAEAGDILVFGLSNIEWRVLAAEKDRCLLITKDIVDKRKYESSNMPTTWNDSYIRKSLQEWYDTNFSAEEKKMIRTTEVVNSGNKRYQIAGSEKTQDKVFLLSIEEALEYFSSNEDRIAYYEGNPYIWWLRSPGSRTDCAALVLVEDIDPIGSDSGKAGDVFQWGAYVENSAGIRPAMWVNREP